MKTLDGILFSRMINSGAANLKAHAREINDLNVFPIPDGDTGDNMLLTIMGGVYHDVSVSESLDVMADRISSGVLLSARGNSGVILSQFIEGIKNGFAGLSAANAREIGEAFRQGVKQAYGSVMTPTEGTILTVLREATEYACEQSAQTPEEFLEAFVEEAKRSLARTPELLPVLKKAGVVDSGAAGLIYIVDGMIRAVMGEDVEDDGGISEKTEELNLDAFDENSVLEFGYCTELLLRLQNAKIDVSAFNVNIIADFLQVIGDSVVIVKSGSIVKLHVHTKTPQKVLDFCQRYGEFLKVKIENMSLQHNSTVISEKEIKPEAERKKYGIVAVACGEGLKNTFRERGADVIVDGGQSMNPSAEDFISAFDEVNADTIFVFPNNSNIILTARQAAQLYEKSDVRVIESKTVGAGYASLAMLDTNLADADAIESDLTMAMEEVTTAEISHCVRDANIDGVELHIGEYIGFVGKELISANDDRLTATLEAIDKLGLNTRDVCIVFCGKDATDEEANLIEKHIKENYRGKEVYIINGGQDIYDYIIIVE